MRSPICRIRRTGISADTSRRRGCPILSRRTGRHVRDSVMIITSVEPVVLRIPFIDGGAGEGIMPNRWTDLDITLVRVETDTGLVGWGEGFGYFCSEAVAATIRRSIAPLLVGRQLSGPAVLNDEIQRKMVLQGRYGISTFALSGVDIALWDLAAKALDTSVAGLIGERRRDTIPAYASLVRYADNDLVATYATRAVDEGFRTVKLHEIEMTPIRRCRSAIGDTIGMIVDVNCNWNEAFTREAIPELIELHTRWLEEPTWPPEDFAQLAGLRETGIPLAAGENACTAVQFAQILRTGAVDYLQPSITKVGGFTELNKIRALNRNERRPLMLHSPYFGPGYLATLQVAAVEPDFELFEYLYVWPQAWLYQDMPLPRNGSVAIPEGPGLGLEPDPDIITRYRVV
ncbi:MAG: mandelate racemase/muconate lactonizing enzyme family protein [Chitinivibrionales bacterium]|nr:mandelate racemase/muconate lactonizing enzyme family protein [Chitinivibrionales bacterium]